MPPGSLTHRDTTLIIGASTPVGRAMARRLVRAASDGLSPAPGRLVLVDSLDPLPALVSEPAPAAGDTGNTKRLWEQPILDGVLDGEWCDTRDERACAEVLRREQPSRLVIALPSRDLVHATAILRAVRAHVSDRAVTGGVDVLVLCTGDVATAITTLAVAGATAQGWRLLDVPHLLAPLLPSGNPIRRVLRHLLLGTFLELTADDRAPRTWIHVDDVAAAIQRAFESPAGARTKLAGHTSSVCGLALQLADELDGIIPEHELTRRDLLLGAPDDAHARGATPAGSVELATAARRLAHWYAANASLLADTDPQATPGLAQDAAPC